MEHTMSTAHLDRDLHGITCTPNGASYCDNEECGCCDEYREMDEEYDDMERYYAIGGRGPTPAQVAEDERDPNECPHCGDTRCASVVAGADCPAMEAEMNRLVAAEREDAHLHQEALTADRSDQVPVKSIHDD